MGFFKVDFLIVTIGDHVCVMCVGMVNCSFLWTTTYRGTTQQGDTLLSPYCRNKDLHGMFQGGLSDIDNSEPCLCNVYWNSQLHQLQSPLDNHMTR